MRERAQGSDGMRVSRRLAAFVASVWQTAQLTTVRSPGRAGGVPAGAGVSPGSVAAGAPSRAAAKASAGVQCCGPAWSFRSSNSGSSPAANPSKKPSHAGSLLPGPMLFLAGSAMKSLRILSHKRAGSWAPAASGPSGARSWSVFIRCSLRRERKQGLSTPGGHEDRRTPPGRCFARFPAGAFPARRGPGPNCP